MEQPKHTHYICTCCLSSHPHRQPQLSRVPRVDPDCNGKLAATPALSPSPFPQLHSSFPGVTPPLTDTKVHIVSGARTSLD